MIEKILSELLVKVLENKGKTRDFLLKQFEKKLYSAFVENNPNNRPKAVQEYKYYILRSLVLSALRSIDKGIFSREVLKRTVSTLAKGAFIKPKESKMAEKFFKEKYGVEPPAFITISPTMVCNLHCIGCYAASHANARNTLPYSTVKRVIQETHDYWGSRFTVISGGEPTMYKSEGKTILDLYADFPDMFFLMYTNSTLIDKDKARRMAELGNVTPAISVEGFEEETDARRGKGVYKKIMRAFENLRNAGVPFGISVTATTKNAELLIGEKFYDFYFDEQGASYMWIFQYMPIGRGIDTKLMPTPEQRYKMLHRWDTCMKKGGRFVADFWNSGIVSDGCIAYGRPGGYLYIDWNGNIMPCVFVPYYVDNIKRLYAQGKTINDALFSEFFKRGREWQHRYGYKYGATPENWFMPCSIRDHYENFKKHIAKEVKPEDENAEAALQDPEYYKAMVEYDEKLSRLTEKLWKEKIIEKSNQ